MAWFKVDDHFAFHPKVIAAGNGAIGLWVRAGAWSAAQMTDGFIPSAMIPALGASEADAEALASQGLWTPCEAGWKFHDWEQCQPTRAQVIDRREKRASAGRIGGVRSGQSRKAAGQTASAPQKSEATAEAVASPPVQPRTNPRTRPVPSSSVPTERATPKRRGANPPTADPANPDPPGDVARIMWDHTQGLIKFMAVREIAERALRAKGATVPSVTAAMTAIYDRGRPITIESVGQELSGKTGRTDQRTTPADDGFWGHNPLEESA